MFYYLTEISSGTPEDSRFLSFGFDRIADRMSSSPLSNGKHMSDNQSWNSSGSEEDLDTEPGPHSLGVAEFGGVLSKVNRPGMI